ncbi:MAG: hypothetical protein KJ597_03780 [Nanoarchaeota archaeon]|nr:hypothetical protein [Nanoarchaeota archaeon]MBU1622666.1 hypothetical protein [Nanoarchaeota archaeon]
MVALSKIVLYLIPIIALVLLGWYYYGSEGGFSKLESTVETVEGYVPNISLGQDELAGGRVEIDAEHREAILRLNETINLMLHGTETNCFVNYSGFPELDEDGTSLTLTYNSAEDKTTVAITGGAGGSQTVTDLELEFEGMQPCVIAGNERITQQFYESYLDPGTSQSPSSAFNPVNSITIAYNTDGHNENRINYGAGFEDFEDGGWLFTPDKRHICFFPTKQGDIGGSCDGDGEEGLDDDCLTDTNEDESIPYRVRHNSLTTCS